MSFEPTALVRCASYEAAEVSAAFDALEGLLPLLDWVQPGMKVLVKPNLIAKRPVETAVTTHPALLAELIRRLSARGAEVTVGDSPGGLFTKKRLEGVYATCFGSAIEQAGGSLNYDVSAQSVFNPQGKVLKQLDIADFVLRADAVISFAKLKTHSMVGYTGAVKNLFGVIPGTKKAEYHFRMQSVSDFCAMLTDLAEFVKPRLSLIDAVVGMEGDGPTFGDPVQVGALIASFSPHCADLAGSALMGLAPGEVPTLREALGRGLIPPDVHGLTILGEPVEDLAVPGYKSIPMREQTGMDFADSKPFLAPLRGVIHRLLEQRPQLERSLCVGCGECARVCPAQAISMETGRPVIDREKCIRCFCCQELCPKGAMKVHRSAVAKLLQQ